MTTASHDPRPIGVFDSGIGGLTAVRELFRVLPGEGVIYFGDTARLPYGSKSSETVTRFSLEIARFLVKQDVKCIVVACNTSSSVALETLERRLDIPVVGVIEPGAEAALAASRHGRIGVIGTYGTVGSAAYTHAILRRRPDAAVIAHACPLFVPLVEEGWLDHPATRLVAETYLRELWEHDIDTLVLGPGITLIDSAAETARAVARQLADSTLHAPRTAEAHVTFVVSDAPDQFKRVGKRFLGERVRDIELVTLGGGEGR